MHAAPKSCNWTAEGCGGSIAAMNEETREQIVSVCTQAAMMMEEISVKALGAAAMPHRELKQLVRELRRDLAAILDALDCD